MLAGLVCVQHMILFARIGNTRKCSWGLPSLCYENGKFIAPFSLIEDAELLEWNPCYVSNDL